MVRPNKCRQPVSAGCGSEYAPAVVDASTGFFGPAALRPFPRLAPGEAGQGKRTFPGPWLALRHPATSTSTGSDSRIRPARLRCAGALGRGKAGEGVHTRRGPGPPWGVLARPVAIGCHKTPISALLGKIRLHWKAEGRKWVLAFVYAGFMGFLKWSG